MSIFTRSSSTHFVRDSNGKVINVEHEGDERRSESVFDRAARNRADNREARRRERNERRYESRYQREQEREAYRKARNEERIKLSGQRGRLAARSPVTAMIPPRRVIHVHVGKKQYQKSRGNKKRTLTPGEFQNRMMRKWGW